MSSVRPTLRVPFVSSRHHIAYKMAWIHLEGGTGSIRPRVSSSTISYLLKGFPELCSRLLCQIANSQRNRRKIPSRNCLMLMSS